MAKMYYNNADAAFHQSCTHLGKHNGNTIPFLNALNRAFSICQSKDVFIVSLLTEIKSLCVIIEINAFQKWDSRNS